MAIHFLWIALTLSPSSSFVSGVKDTDLNLLRGVPGSRLEDREELLFFPWDEGAPLAPLCKGSLA